MNEKQILEKLRPILIYYQNDGDNVTGEETEKRILDLISSIEAEARSDERKIWLEKVKKEADKRYYLSVKGDLVVKGAINAGSVEAYETLKDLLEETHQ